jgi:hypothetical protein
MLYPASNAASHPAPTWLLVPPPLLEDIHLSEEAAVVLDLLTTVTNAPAAIPPDLWDAPIRSLQADTASDLLKHICTALATRIPFLSWDMPDWDEGIEGLHAFFQIPVVPAGVDTCNGDIDGSGAVLTWIGALCGFAVDDLTYPLPEELPLELDLLNLAPLLATRYAGHPLAGLADVVNILDHRTGTFFLDACPACWQPEMDEGTEWDDENLDWLEQDAARAQVIMDRIDALETWVAQKPTRIGEVWQAIVDTHTLEQEAVARQRPKTLMDVWGSVPLEAPEDDTALPEGVIL